MEKHKHETSSGNNQETGALPGEEDVVQGEDGENRVDWNEIDKALVHGVSATGNSKVVRHPSYRELASKYHIALSSIARYAKSHDCLKRRKAAQQKVRDRIDARLCEFRADQYSVSVEDEMRAMDIHLIKYEEALRDGRVPTNSVSDFCNIVKLRHNLMAEVENRNETLGGITLEDLQLAHRKMLDDLRNMPPELGGLVRPAKRLERRDTQASKASGEQVSDADGGDRDD